MCVLWVFRGFIQFGVPKSQICGLECLFSFGKFIAIISSHYLFCTPPFFLFLLRESNHIYLRWFYIISWFWNALICSSLMFCPFQDLVLYNFCWHIFKFIDSIFICVKSTDGSWKDFSLLFFFPVLFNWGKTGAYYFISFRCTI